MLLTKNKPMILKVVDELLENRAYVSCVPASVPGYVYLVIGAPYSKGRRAIFSKNLLKKLITELDAVHDGMEG